MVADDADVCFRTAQRWVSLYRKLGLVALARKSRGDRGARRVVSPKIKAAIEGLALERPPLPIRSICRQIRQFAEATRQRLPRYGIVYDLVREVPGSLLTPAGVVLPNEQLVPEVIASLIRMSGGNFRLLTRLLTQIERVLSVNDLHVISTAVVEAARDSLVIGPG